MKIGTVVRTRNAADHIDYFLGSHSFSDVILVADGGSTDGTLERLAEYHGSFPHDIKYRSFDERIYNSDGTWYNHESRHYQFLFDWAKEEKLDWLIADDIDHVCNNALYKDARKLLESNKTPFAYALLMYVWGGYDSKVYFPALNNCNPSERLWAWRPKEWTPDLNLDADKTIEIRNQPDALLTPEMIIPHPPYVVRHYSWLNEASTRAKMAFNAKRGVLQAYPLGNPDCGELVHLPDWAY